MAEKYPSQSSHDQTKAPRDQSEPTKDHYGLVIDQTEPIDQHGQVAEHTGRVSQQLQTLKHQVSALQLAQTAGAQTVYNIETQYNVSGGQKIQNIDYPGQTQPSTSGMSTESAATFNLQECQEELRAYYLEEMGKVNLLPWIPEENKDMESIFVDLELVRPKASQASQNIQTNEDLVTLTSNQGHRVNRVLVTGDAGSGKSTTAGNLAYKWAVFDPQSPLSKFSLVFLIRMKDIKDRNSNLVDLIFQNILPEDSNVSKEGLSMYIKENAEDILFVIDGMDEDSSCVLKNKSSGITKLLHNRKLRKSCVILTTRPKNISDLGMYASHYTQVKLDGFSVDNIFTYIVKYFRDDKTTVDRLFRTLDAEPHILALASMPVLLLMICLLWEDQQITPKTKAQLYQKTIGYLWRRYKARMSEDQALDSDSDNDEFDQELTDLLHKLGKVALYNTYLDMNKSIFTVKEFERDVCNLGCQVGILKREQSRVGLERKISVAFLHATFQEFCAAFYLAHLLDTKQKTLEEFDGKLFSLLSEDKFICKGYVIEFCCGIQPLVTTTFLQLHTKSISKVPSEIYQSVFADISIHMQHIFEGQLSYEQCSNLIPMFPSYGTGFDVTVELIPSILYMLELYKSSATQTGILSSVKSLKFKTRCTPWLPTLLKHTSNLCECSVRLCAPENVADLDKMFKALSELQNIKVLVLCTFLGILTPLYHRCDATNLLLFLTEKKVKLTQFKLLGFQFDEKVMVGYLSSTSTSIKTLVLHGTHDVRGEFAAINKVIDIIPRLKHLNSLDVSLFQIHSAIKHLRPVMSQLKKLVLMFCCFHEQNLKELFSFLSRAQQLIEINLSHIFFSVASVQALVESLKKIPALEELNLSDTYLNDESACILARFVREKPLLALCLDYNPGIGHAGKDALKGLPLKRYVPLGKFDGKYENIDTI